MVRGIRPHVAGRIVRDVADCGCLLKPISIRPKLPAVRMAIRGRTLTDVTRWAKRVILNFDDGAAIAVEPRMTGLMLVDDAPNQTHLRVRWTFDGDRQLWFWDRRGLGTIAYYKPGQLESDLKAKLGPDALLMTPATWRLALQQTGRPVKVAMLEQKLVAGIGNMYASEILHRAEIDPRTRANRISKPRCERINEATHHILLEAIRYEGSTLGDGTYRNALNQDGSYQNSHQVYAREGEPCFRCGGTVRRIVQAQRSTFFCPECQKREPGASTLVDQSSPQATVTNTPALLAPPLSTWKSH